MIRTQNNVFSLETEHTCYLFSLTETNHLEHLYYGRKLRLREAAPLREKHAFVPGGAVWYSDTRRNISLEDACLEVSSGGKGDLREPFVEIVWPDGSFTSDFVFDCYEVTGEKPGFDGMPGSYSEGGEAEHLCILLKERHKPAVLELHYYVYPECDVICRSARLRNTGDAPITIKRLLSTQLDFPDSGWVFTTFTGSWAREMRRTDVPASAGKCVNASCAGVSSNRANPFVMLSRPHTTQDAGDCFGLNLIYSGNHYEAVEVSPWDKTRFVSGINPQSFSWTLGPGEAFEAPEAVMSFSHEGFNALSQNMHLFVREHIVRGAWKRKVRPVLLNSWEAAYFNIDEHKLLALAKAGRDAGAELFVMDDGWFGERNDDTRSLGDWEENRKKLPGGLKGLCEKVNALGLDFGIWVEPEMVNVNSRLYRAHPDWTLDIPGRQHSEGRSQRVLDLGRQDVQDYIIDRMTRVFSSARNSYVKWDMNRVFSDVYSKALPPQRQGEVSHRYVLGLYRCMKTLTERFPHILFEGCSSGGNRFDLGILSYFPQIWASDNTDALCRAEIQTGYSYGYPLSVLSAHVSACPNHQTLRDIPLETRFAVAAFGVCGYECNLRDMSRDELTQIKAQIALYKQWRDVFQFGRFYRGRLFDGGGSAIAADGGNLLEWCCVSQDRKRAAGLLLQKLTLPNQLSAIFRAKGLDEGTLYRFCNRKPKYGLRAFGGLVNRLSPIHIKQGSLLESAAAKVVKLEGETEDCLLYGDALMYHGVKLKQAFGSVGYGKDTRVFPDFAARLYWMEEAGTV